MPPLLLEALGITKSFAGVHALTGVSFDLRPGEVHALVGENGAGKSTLIRIITGAETPDAGTLTVSGRGVARMDPGTSRALGIAAIYQQPSLFPHLTVAENIAWSLETGPLWRRIDWRARQGRAVGLLARAGTSIDPARRAETLSLPEQQLVEIAKAIGAGARIVVMDEPTAALNDAEVNTLFAVIQTLRDEGAGIVYISHRLEEVFAIADRVTVLRDGATVATHGIDEVDRPSLIRLMVGRELTALFPKRSVPLGEVALELARVSNREAGVHDISLSIRGGEILGLAGLAGCRRSELAETIFGLTPADAGEIRIQGAAARLETPAAAIQRGIGYVPKDRRQHGIVAEMSIAENVTLASLAKVSRAGLVQRAEEQTAAADFMSRLRIRAPSAFTDVAALSGGNQQKVALARWLMTGARVLILDEPTQGVDVGAKAEIHALIMDLAGQGVAVLMMSSDLPELLGMCDRIAVMHDGAIAGELSRAEATAPAILAMALSGVGRALSASAREDTQSELRRTRRSATREGGSDPASEH
ncbi:MAG TPA: sugar ABC transporter ATP-binding protein [Vicinamibacterales bacterium]|nr:sugar ABC transporter ATP-binding protein [Vicinamibacterales bacterium]